MHVHNIFEQKKKKKSLQHSEMEPAQDTSTIIKNITDFNY